MYPGNLAFFPADWCTVNIGEKQDNVLCWSFVFVVVGLFGEGWVWVCACFPHKSHHTVERVLCGTHTSSSIGRSNDRQRFLFARTLFRGRRIGVRIVTHENRSREDWGSFRFLFCVKWRHASLMYFDVKTGAKTIGQGTITFQARPAGRPFAGPLAFSLSHWPPGAAGAGAPGQPSNLPTLPS